MPLLRTMALLGTLVLTAACSDGSAPVSTRSDTAEIEALTRSIQALGPEIRPDEAQRAARIALIYPRELRARYQVTDGPLIHNMKVNLGLRPRGLCYHWADDMETRLRQEGFQTLQLHRAIANADNIRIEHSTVIVSARNDGMNDGIVLDPWRYGGRLFWSRTPRDPDYQWISRGEVFEYKRTRRKWQDRREAAG